MLLKTTTSPLLFTLMRPGAFVISARISSKFSMSGQNFSTGPLLDDTVRVIGDTGNGVYGRETAQKVHQRLREVGGVNVPREFVFMDRAALGLGSVFIHLKAEINWHRLFEDMISGFNLEETRKRQATALKKFSITS